MMVAEPIRIDLEPAVLDSIPIIWSRLIPERETLAAIKDPKWVVAHPITYARCFPTPTKDYGIILERLARVWVTDALNHFDQLQRIRQPLVSSTERKES